MLLKQRILVNILNKQDIEELIIDTAIIHPIVINYFLVYDKTNYLKILRIENNQSGQKDN